MSWRSGEQNVQKDKVIWETKVSGQISSFSFSPLQPEKLAVGCDFVLINDLNDHQWQKFDVSRRSSVRLIVTCLIWHPKESIIAFGTDNGTVGVVDVEETTKKTTNVRFFVHKQQSVIFSLAWGPCSKISDTSDSLTDHSKLFLYSCGHGQICLNDPCNPGLRPVNFDNLVESKEKRFYTDICWKSDYSQVAAAIKFDFQNIYNGITFDLLFRISCTEVWCFCWHPFSMLNSSQSTLHEWVAISLNQPVIYVYDLGINKAAETDIVPIIEPIRELSGHLYNVNKIDWSPHIEGRLASCSKDGTVQIWDVISGQPLVNFNHNTPVLAVKWILFDPDQVVSGDRNSRFCCWRLSEQVQTPLDPDRVRKFQRRGGYSKKQQHATISPENDGNVNRDKTAQPAAGKERDGVKRFQKREPCPKKRETTVHHEKPIGHVTANIAMQPIVRKKTEDQNVPEMKMQSFQKCTSTFFSQYEDDDIATESNAKIQQESNVDIVEPMGNCDSSLADVLGKPPDDKCIIDFVMEKLLIWKRDHIEEYEKMFKPPRSQIPENTLLSAFIGKTEDFYKLITLCSACPFTVNHYKEYVHRIIQRSIIPVMPKEFLNANSFLIGLSMAGSKKDWLSACCSSYKHIVKLKTKRDVWLNYLLVANQLSEAFNQMNRKKQSLEAYAISKLRLPQEDALVKKCELKMLQDFQRRNKPELYCFFYLCRGDVLNAAKVLSKRFSIAASLNAAYLCRAHGFMDEALQYSFSCIVRGLSQKKYDEIKVIVTEQPEVKDLQWVITIHEALVKNMAAMSTVKKYGICEENLFQNEELSEKSVILWKSYDMEGIDFLSHMLKSLKDEKMLDFGNPDFLNTFASFKTFAQDFIKNNLSDCDMMIRVTFCICDFFMTLLSSNSGAKFNEAFQLIGNAMMHYFNSDNFLSLNKICLLCFPFDILWNNREKTLEVRLNTDILGQNVIKEAYERMETIVSSVVQKNIDISKKMKEQINYQFVKKKFTEKELEKELLSLSPVDVIFTYFAINFVKMLSKKAKNLVTKRFDRHHKCKNFTPTVLENAGIGDPPQITVSEEVLGKIEKLEEKEPVVPNEKEPLQVAVPEKKEPSQAALLEEKESSQAAMPNERDALGKDEKQEEKKTALLKEKEPSQAAVLEKKEPSQVAVLDEKEPAQMTVLQEKEEISLSEEQESPKTMESEKKELAQATVPEEKEPALAAVLNEVKPSQVAVPEEKEPLQATVSEEKDPSQAAMLNKIEPLQAAVLNEIEPSQAAVPDEKESAQTVVSDEKKPTQAIVSEEKELPQSVVLGGKEHLEDKAFPQTEVKYLNYQGDRELKFKTGSLLTLVPENKEKTEHEMCDLCKSKNSENQGNCCLNALKPFLHLFSAITANICNDIFKINEYFQTKQFAEVSNFWNMTIVTETTSDLDEFSSSVDDFIKDRNKLLDMLKLLEGKGQVKEIPNVIRAAQILGASVEKIKKSCMCPCMKFELQLFVDYILKF